jgi:hypothetical protein
MLSGETGCQVCRGKTRAGSNLELAEAFMQGLEIRPELSGLPDQNGAATAQRSRLDPGAQSGLAMRDHMRMVRRIDANERDVVP